MVEKLSNEELIELEKRLLENKDSIPLISSLRTVSGKPKYKVLDEDDGYHD